MFTSVCDVSRPPLTSEFKDSGFAYATERPDAAGTLRIKLFNSKWRENAWQGVRILKFMDDSAGAVTDRRRKKKILISRSQERVLGLTS